MMLLMPLLAALAGGPAPAGVTLDSARQLYATAAYDEALAALDLLRISASDAEAGTIDTYRASCLAALNRTSDAEGVIDEMVRLQPAQRDIDAPPKVQALFVKQRERALPDIVKALFDHARRLFEEKDAAAAAAFDEVTTLLKDPVFEQDSRRATASDLRTIAASYADLSRSRAAAAVVKAPAPAAAQSPSAASAGAPVLSASPQPTPRRLFRSSDADVMPPVALFQPMHVGPEVLRAIPAGLRSVRLLVTVSERGTIESAAIEQPVNPIVDSAFISAVKTWRYKPAQRNGVPVAYVQGIELRMP